jgi:malate dehydrogenase (oxaloacetate-decarboxylating)(NADP+)
MDTGVARRPIIDMEAYEPALKARMDPTASILQGLMPAPARRRPG